MGQRVDGIILIGGNLHDWSARAVKVSDGIYGIDAQSLSMYELLVIAVVEYLVQMSDIIDMYPVIISRPLLDVVLFDGCRLRIRISCGHGCGIRRGSRLFNGLSVEVTVNGSVEYHTVKFRLSVAA